MRLVGMGMVFGMIVVMGMGCTATPQASMVNGAFTSEGIPHERYLVGGGYNIEFSARENGTVYLVLKTTQPGIGSENKRESSIKNRLLVSKTLIKDGGFSENIQPEKLKKEFAVEPSDAEIKLYFVPAHNM